MRFVLPRLSLLIVMLIATVLQSAPPAMSVIAADTVVAPALVVDVDAGTTTIAVGDTITYTITISNVGGGLATHLVLTRLLPKNVTYVAGSGRVNGKPFTNPSTDIWGLPDLSGGAAAVVTFQAYVNSAVAGVPYVATASASGVDSQGLAIPTDQHVRVPDDTDPDDRATVRVYGPLAWKQTSVSVAFEDLKKAGWSDWDYNDFIVQIHVNQGLTPAGELAVAKLTYISRARGSGFDHRFEHALPMLGGGRADLVVSNGAGQPIARQRSTFGDEPSFVIFDRTQQVLPPNDHVQINTWPDQTTYLQGYTAALTLVLDDPKSNLASDLPPIPWDPSIFVYDTGQEIHLVMPGHLDNTQKVNDVFDSHTPLRGFDLPLANVFPTDWRWPIEYAGIWLAYPSYVGYVKRGGAQNKDWFSGPKAHTDWIWQYAPPTQNPYALRSQGDGSDSAYFGGPTVADLDGDGRPEIAIGNLLANQVELYDAQRQMLPGWPQATGGGVKASPTLADLDGDGTQEILASSEDGKLYAWHRDGMPVSGWPIQVGTARLLATPAIADLDHDGTVDIIVPLSDGKLYAFNANGTSKTGWPVSIGENADQNGSQIINSTPKIADLDGSGMLQVIVGSTDHRLYVFNADGTLAWSYLTGDMILGAPVVADFDATHAGQEIVVASGDSYVYLLSNTGARIWRKRTDWTIRSTPLAADLAGDQIPEILVGGDDGKLYAWNGDGSLVPGWPQTIGAPTIGGPAVGDLDGDGTPEIIVGSDDAHVYAWHSDGTPVLGWPKATSQAIKGAPAVAALHSGAPPTVVVGDSAGNVYLLDMTQKVYLPLVRR